MLFSEGIDDLRELPHTHFDAIARALVFLGYEEKLDADEYPPKRIWLDGEAMKAHFEQVKKNRDAQMKGEGSGEIDDPVSNDAAKSLIAG